MSDAPSKMIMYVYLRHGCWWLNRVKPDGLPDLFCFKSVVGLSLIFKSVPNYKSLQESWRVKLSQYLTKIIDKNTKIYDIKQVYYENITDKESNDT